VCICASVCTCVCVYVRRRVCVCVYMCFCICCSPNNAIGTLANWLEGGIPGKAFKEAATHLHTGGVQQGKKTLVNPVQTQSVRAYQECIVQTVSRGLKIYRFLRVAHVCMPAVESSDKTEVSHRQPPLLYSKLKQ